MQELERADSGLRSLASVQGSLALYAIHSFGSAEQHARWMPGLVSGEKVGCFGLTEHGHGSDPGGMETRAKRDGDHYVLNGSKCWIGNASIADVKVIWAKDDDGRVGGFVVEGNVPGFRAQDIEGKFSLRMSRTSECWFENCRIPAANRLPNAKGLRAPLTCLSQARVGIAWGVIGAAIDCYETALAYAKTREQFGKPIASFQLVQEKLVWMVQEITKAQLLALRLTRMMEAGEVRPAQISLAKRNNVWMALECARKARDLLGAVGIIDRYSVIRHMLNLESVYTYEGTHDVHMLVIGQDVTGIDAFGGISHLAQRAQCWWNATPGRVGKTRCVSDASRFTRARVGLAFGYGLTSCPECPIHLRSRERKLKVERDPRAALLRLDLLDQRPG